VGMSGDSVVFHGSSKCASLHSSGWQSPRSERIGASLWSQEVLRVSLRETGDRLEEAEHTPLSVRGCHLDY
jgi:hypothetical protein